MMVQEEWAEEEMETLHVYVVPEHPRRSGSWKRRLSTGFLATVALLLTFLFCCVSGQPLYAQKQLFVPAHVLPLQVFRVQVTLVPTGIQHLPATSARGTLTLYNGSFVSQSIPAGLLVTSADGTEVVTEHTVNVPAADPPVWGIAIVEAVALVSGASGNLPASALHQFYGPALSLTNLTAFTGGHNTSTRRFVTSRDQTRAHAQARTQLTARLPHNGLLAHPCTEQDTSRGRQVLVQWQCQYLSYQVPSGVQVLSAQIAGRFVLLTARVLVLPS